VRSSQNNPSRGSFAKRDFGVFDDRQDRMQAS
jgi:hypothetical protein